MSVLVDTSFFLAVKSLRDSNHARAVDLFREILRGEHGVAHTSDFIFAEAITAALARTHRHSAAVGIGELILLRQSGAPLFVLDHVAPEQVREAWAEFQRYKEKDLSMTDWTSVVLARHLEADAILSFDGGFDGVYARRF